MKKILLGILFLGLFAVQFTSCNNGGGDEPKHGCNNYQDANCDGICDNCKEPLDADAANVVPCAVKTESKKPAKALASAEVGKR